MRLSTIVISSVAVVLASAAFALQSQSAQSPLIGKAAPAFSTSATDGKTYSLDNVSKKAPMIMVFWKNPCPHNPRAAPMVNSIVEAYKGKVNFVGVVNSDGDRAKSFQKEFGPNYPILNDGDKSIIKDYKMAFSIQFVVVDKDKKVETIIGGYSKDSMEKLNAAMAKAAGMDKASLDFSNAPSRTTYG